MVNTFVVPSPLCPSFSAFSAVLKGQNSAKAGRRWDVIVIGGGPAGAQAARHLAAGGARVALLDRPPPGGKVCGGCLTAPAWDELGRPEALQATPVREAVFEWSPLPGEDGRGGPLAAPGAPAPACRASPRRSGAPPGRSRAAIQVRGDAVLVDRDRLDAYLVARAEEAGAHLFRTRARQVRRSASGWTVETEGPTFAAPFLVGADGCRSIVRRAVAGPWRPSDVVLAVGVTAEWPDLAPGVCRPGMVRALFPAARRGRQDAARHGYAYVFGRSDGAVLGYWRRGSGGREVLAGLWGLCERWLCFCSKTASPLTPPLFRGGEREVMGQPVCGSGPSPAEADCGPRRRPLPHPRGRMMPCLASGGAATRATGGADWMLVGDAAGHVNPVTGEGIRYALRGGRLAAEAILDGRPRSYGDRWEADFGGFLRWGSRLMEFCEWTTVLRRLIGRAERSDRGARALADLAFARRDYAGLYFKGAAAYALDALLG